MANKYTVQESNNLAIGQTHSAHLHTASQALTPPSNTVFIALHIINEVRFTALLAENPNKCIGTNTSDNYAGGSGDIIASTIVFPAGTVLYGRWTSLTISHGSLNAYCGG